METRTGPENAQLCFIFFTTATKTIGCFFMYQIVKILIKFSFSFLVNCLLGSAVLRKAKENQPSSYKEGRLDTPIDAALFLKRFSIQNMKLLKELDLKTTKKYDWSKRESSPEGTPILELIDYVILKLFFF